MKKMKWHYDPLSAYWACTCSHQFLKALKFPSKPANQYPGHETKESIWDQHILEKAFPAHCAGLKAGNLICSPSNIIQCFRDKRVLEALALIVSWGGMGRTKNYIYTKSLKEIESTLLGCVSLIRKEGSIRESWDILVMEMDWTKAMVSKCLHFLARSLGYEVNPPVPLDGAVIIKKVWPCFIKSAENYTQSADPPLPDAWSANSFSAFSRYMTVINCWASYTGWTTTQLENTLYDIFH